MDTKWIEDFLSLAETKSFTRSSELRFTTQSAFSRRIKALETWAGAQLFDRSLQPVALTEAGEVFRDHAEDLMRRLRTTRETVMRQSSLQQGTVSITAPHSLATEFFPPWLKRISEKIGPVNTRLLPCSFPEGVALMTDRGCEFMLTYCKDDALVDLGPGDYASRLIGADALVPLSAPAEGGGPRHRADALRPAPFLGYAATSRFSGAVQALLDAHDEIEVESPPTFTSPYANILRSMVLHGYGFAWLLENETRAEVQAGELVRAGPADWDIPLEIRLFRPRKPISRVGEEVWNAAVALGLGQGDERRA